jgi:hypothetical protein
MNLNPINYRAVLFLKFFKLKEIERRGDFVLVGSEVFPKQWPYLERAYLLGGSYP